MRIAHLENSSPSWKNSSTKEGRSAKRIKKDRKRNKER